MKRSDFEEIVTLERDPKDQPLELGYEKTVLYRTPEGQWIYAGFKGPMSRYVLLGNSSLRPPDPDYFLVTPDDVLQLFEYAGWSELVEQYFPAAGGA